MYYIYIPPPQTAAAALTPEEFDDLAGKTNDFSAEKDGADGDDELPVADPPSFTRNRNIERNGGKPPAKASASSSSSNGKPANKFEVCIYISHVTVYWYMSHCYVRCIFMIFQAHKIELEALYAELEKQARMAGAGDDDGATVAAASASAAAKPSSSASSSSASASASASSSAQDGSGPARKRRRSAVTATASSAAVRFTFEDDEDVSSFFLVLVYD